MKGVKASVRPQLPERLYHWTAPENLVSILEHGLEPRTSRARGGHNRGKQVVFLQEDDDPEFASSYFNMPTRVLRLAIATAGLDGEWSGDLAAWNDWPGDPEEGLEGTIDDPTAGDTLRYTGCVCYHGHIPPTAIVEVVEVEVPESFVSI